MSAGLWSVSVTAASLGSGVVGGVLYGFSAFVMRGLDATRPGTAVAAMQEMNRAAPRAPLTVPLLGTALLCVLLTVRAASDVRGGDNSTQAWWVLAGCALYLLVIVITGAYHVPRNDRLNLLDPSAADMDGTWRHYVSGWLAWNHARTAAAVGASVAFVLGLGASA